MVHIHESVDAAQTQGKGQKNQDASVKASLEKIKNKFIVLSSVDAFMNIYHYIYLPYMIFVSPKSCINNLEVV